MVRNFTMWCAAAFFALTAASASAQTILPKSFADWTAASAGSFSPAQAGANSTDARAAKEYDFVSGEHDTYTHAASTEKDTEKGTQKAGQPAEAERSM